VLNTSFRTYIKYDKATLNMSQVAKQLPQIRRHPAWSLVITYGSRNTSSLSRPVTEVKGKNALSRSGTEFWWAKQGSNL
jgi:hypothetical protein